MKIEDTYLPCNEFRNIFIVQDRNFWIECPVPLETKTDLVLTFDFALVNEIRAKGGQAYFVDHLIKTEIVQKYNQKVTDFFKGWYLDSHNRDMFAFHGINLGSSFRLEIWNDLTYAVRLYVNLLIFKTLKYDKIYCGNSDKHIESILNLLQVQYVSWSTQSKSFSTYFFPIFTWMDEKIRKPGINYHIKRFVAEIINWVLISIDRIKGEVSTDIFITKYQPTYSIIEQLRKEPGNRILLEAFTSIKDLKGERMISVGGPKWGYRKSIKKILADFDSNKACEFIIEGHRISDWLYKIIIDRITPRLPVYFCFVDRICKFLNTRKLKLAVFITNIGIKTSIINEYCKMKNIPTFLIINGFLTGKIEFEAKDAVWINAYSESIKKNYFYDTKNVLCLGDPRMDQYMIKAKSSSKLNLSNPTIMIGAGGFNNVDLNSYVAIEFGFLFDVITALEKVKTNSKTQYKLVLKVRPNGYITQYRKFLKEYFPNINVDLYDTFPIKDLFPKTDFYISIYSQTLFEASCHGIPVLYYKNDTEIIDPPFDGNSELVTARNVDDLVEKITAFYSGSEMYSKFMERSVMEKYIGPLDGKNLERNVEMIKSLVSNKTIAKKY